MPKRDSRPKFDRRKFLTAAAVAGAGTAVTSAKAATAVTPDAQAPRAPSALPPNAYVAANETGTPQMPESSGGRPGSDFMVDVIKTLDIKYLPANPAASYRGLHESLIDYGKNTMPEFLTCMHEESAVGMCHGYFKATGKPIMTLVHGVVGPATRHHGDLQRLVRPRAGAGHRRQRSRRRASSAAGVRRSTPRRTSTPSCATTPNGTTLRCRRSTSRSRSCACTRSRPRRPTVR